MVFSVFIFISGLISFCLKRKHLLLMLLSLEMITLGRFLNLYLYMSFLDCGYYFILIFLTTAVCESVIGLSILVMMVRSFGNDYIQSFSILYLYLFNVFVFFIVFNPTGFCC